MGCDVHYRQKKSCKRKKTKEKQNYYVGQKVPLDVFFFMTSYRKPLTDFFGQPSIRLHVCSVAQSCLTLCDPMDSSLPASSVHRILQARILEWVAVPFSRGSSWPRNQTQILCINCTGRLILYHWATREANITVHKMGKHCHGREFNVKRMKNTYFLSSVYTHLHGERERGALEMLLHHCADSLCSLKQVSHFLGTHVSEALCWPERTHEDICSEVC